MAEALASNQQQMLAPQMKKMGAARHSMWAAVWLRRATFGGWIPTRRDREYAQLAVAATRPGRLMLEWVGMNSATHGQHCG